MTTTGSPPVAASLKKKISGQFAWALAGRIIAALMQALLLILVARHATVSQFGILGATLGAATLMQTAFDMGIQPYVTRERVLRGDSGSIAKAFRFNLITSFFLLVVSTAILAILAFLVNVDFVYLLPLGVWVSLERTADLRLSVSFADGDVRGNAVNLSSRRVGATALFAVLIWLHTEPLFAYSLSVATAAFGSLIFVTYYTRGRVTARPDISFTELFRACWPFWLNSVSAQARNLDTTIAAACAGSVQAGLFAVASRVTNPLRLLPSTFASILLPHAARASGSRRDAITLLKLSSAILGATTALYCVVAAVIPWFVPFALGDSYTSAVWPVLIVIFGLPFAAAVSLFSSMLQGYGFKHFVATISTISVVICLPMVGLGAYLSGAVGASIALTVSFVLQAAANLLGIYYLVLGRRAASPRMIETDD
ncbi:oligosaccharide flippase family protein [Gordonia alkanivorans]|uniref:oligosaccharide flippase family protein n=1 Tax=Gordonia alkanivorans TaxID=84096 RepID=UPI0024B76AEF|nr:oligosaccharide flippase family protein [Gordonia alkanivorans]MDJ0029634.1 oligosaccharide flippase family protein [Gordonia alkanivorans]